MHPVDPHSTSNVADCQLVKLPRFVTDRGSLSVAQNDNSLPFAIKRVYYLYDLPVDTERGGHSHRHLHQYVIALAGSFTVTLTDGCDTRHVTLNRPYQALHIVPGIWRVIDNFSSGSICLVLASEVYDEADYIRDYQEFISLTKNKR